MTGYRRQVAEDLMVIIAVHRSDDLSRCVDCGEEYPCGPARLAGRAVDMLARKLQTPAPDGAGDPIGREL
jgi:hypothetical protein